MAKPKFPFDALIAGTRTVPGFSDEIRFQIPLPPVELSPNRNFHFSVTAFNTSEYRQSVGWLTKAALLAAGGVKFESCVIHARYVIIDRCPVANEYKVFTKKGKETRIPVKYRPQDSANGVIAMKAAQDGMIDAGLCKTDSHHYVMQGLAVIERMTPPHARARGFQISCIEVIVQGTLAQ